MISIVSPVYRAAEILPLLVSEIETVMKKLQIDYEIVLVDDRSPDNSWEVMRKLASTNANLKIFRLSRNFGQHPTIMAGLSKAKGDWIVVMDCDMQDQPKEIEKLYQKVLTGYEVVLAERSERKDSYFKKLGSKIFYKVFNYLSGMDFDGQVANFGIYHKKVIQSILNLNDYIKFFPLFVRWVGYKTTTVSVEHNEREEGKSSYNLKRLVSLAFNTIISFSDKPLRIFVTFGIITSGTSFLIGLYYLIQTFIGNIKEPGFSSLIISIWFLSGLIISIIGLVGIYLGKTFDQTKNRPVFIIDESNEN